MDFDSVHQILKELFPQVDARLLKAAAIEHPNDPDASVEFILTEVLPCTTEKLGASSYVTQSPASLSSAENERDSVPRLAISSCASSSGHSSTSLTVEAANVSGEMNDSVHDSSDSTYAKIIGDQLIGNSWEAASSRSLDLNIPYQVDPTCLNESIDRSLHSSLRGAEDIGDHLSINSGKAASGAGSMSKDTMDSNCHNGSNYVELASLSAEDHRLEPLDCSIQSEVLSSMSASNHNVQEFNGVADDASKEDSEVPDNATKVEESSSMHTVLTKSGQLCSTDLLEDIVEDAKSHKKILFSAMESVLKLMREVELQEKITEQVKEEAVKGGLDILAKVEELKGMLKRAREANDMHSGEVYGERAILATEMRELQSRLLILSDEKDASLSVLDTMQQALQTRLASAEAERIAAEQEKREKEESAQRALAEQELIMEKVVQESKKLQLEAEENAKLREFLVDRGHVVDTLQGEISVICQDVKFLKENFDSDIPLNKCLSSKQTSCILASSRSASSVRSTESEQALEQSNWSSSSEELFMIPSVERVSESDHKELVEEGWELFDAEP